MNFSDFLSRIPAVTYVGPLHNTNGRWHIQIVIDIDHDLAWQVVQELGYVFNNLSIEEPLPTRFYPTSPPPYLNGGSKDYLSWIIESMSADFKPQLAEEWLAARLPHPIEDEKAWETWCERCSSVLLSPLSKNLPILLSGENNFKLGCR